jgi:sporulation protein YlmC with PRC-barrel domain
MVKIVIASAAAALMMGISASGFAQTSAEQPASPEQPTTNVLTDPAAPAVEQPTEQALAIPEAIMASALIGADIYSSNNENIAEVKDVILSQEGGKATHVIVNAGDNDLAVEMSKLKFVATDYGFKVVLDGTQADLASFPVINQ